MGVFLGFPLQSTQSWITDSWFTSSNFNGVYLPDFFPNDGLNGLLGATIVTIIFALIVIALAYKYENHRKMNKTYDGVGSELEQYAITDKETIDKNYTFKLFSEDAIKRFL